MFGQETDGPRLRGKLPVQSTVMNHFFFTFHFSHLGFSPAMPPQKKISYSTNQRISSMGLIWIRRLTYFDHGLQLDGVSCKFADAIRQFLHGHPVFVVLPAERLLIQMNLLQITGLGYTHKVKLRSLTSILLFNAAFWRRWLSDRHLSPRSASSPRCCGPG